MCKTVTIAVRDYKLNTFTRQTPLNHPSQLSETIASADLHLFKEHVDFKNPLRSIGVKASDLVSEHDILQLDIFMAYDDEEKSLNLEKTIETIRQRYGFSSVQRALMLRDTELSGFNPKADHVIFPEAYFKGS